MTFHFFKLQFLNINDPEMWRTQKKEEKKKENVTSFLLCFAFFVFLAFFLISNFQNGEEKVKPFAEK